MPRQLLKLKSKKAKGTFVTPRNDATQMICGEHVGACGCACNLQLSLNDQSVITHTSFDVKQLILRADGTPLRCVDIQETAQHTHSFTLQPGVVGCV